MLAQQAHLKAKCHHVSSLQYQNNSNFLFQMSSFSENDINVKNQNYRTDTRPCAHYLCEDHSCAKPMVFWCKSGLCKHLARIFPTAKPPMIHRVFSQTGKNQETWSNILHMATYFPTFKACTPLTQVPCVPKSLPRALRNIMHLREWGTSSEDGGGKSL